MRRTLRGLMAAPTGPFSEYAPVVATIKPDSRNLLARAKARHESRPYDGLQIRRVVQTVFEAF